MADNGIVEQIGARAVDLVSTRIKSRGLQLSRGATLVVNKAGQLSAQSFEDSGSLSVLFLLFGLVDTALRQRGNANPEFDAKATIDILRPGSGHAFDRARASRVQGPSQSIRVRLEYFRIATEVDIIFTHASNIAAVSLSPSITIGHIIGGLYRLQPEYLGPALNELGVDPQAFYDFAQRYSPETPTTNAGPADEPAIDFRDVDIGTEDPDSLSAPPGSVDASAGDTADGDRLEATATIRPADATSAHTISESVGYAQGTSSAHAVGSARNFGDIAGPRYKSLQSVMESDDITVEKLGELTGYQPTTLRQILAGSRPISRTLAGHLARLFGQSPEFWLTDNPLPRAPRTISINAQASTQPIADVRVDVLAGASADTPGSSPGTADAASMAPREIADIDLVDDEPEQDYDALGRSILAIGVARRLHRIWGRANSGDTSRARDDDRAGFLVHIDAPWGGGKTSFANYVARTLCPPSRAASRPARFLDARYPGLNVGGIFLEDPPIEPDDVERLTRLPDDQRRPWIVVPFNAWQSESCSPPWWIFYQTIRRRTFDAVRREGTRPWTPAEPVPAMPTRIDRALARYEHWIGLWIAEFWFRLWNPKVRTLLFTALLSVAVLGLLELSGTFGSSKATNGTLTSGFLVSSGIGLLLAGLTGISAVWGLGALLTEAIVPGSDTVAERLNLGNGDPFERFRRHFNATMRRVNRPVLVIIDDLDRCGPEFVVDLIRGIQTLLRSPRVVFMILGEREWIDTAFEIHNKEMKGVDFGPEQSLGARFVEKAIQMSFMLPAATAEDQTGFVRSILLGGKGAGPQTLSDELKSRVRTFANNAVSGAASATLDSAPIIERVITDLRSSGADPLPDDSDALRDQVAKAVNDTLAINATSDARVEEAIVHQLEVLADCFPPNPRQVKRIVNTITIYFAVALQRPNITPDAAFRRQLALWIIIMIEWPESWRLLVCCPELIDVIAAKNWKQALAKLAKRDAGKLPGTFAATTGALENLLADDTLCGLIRGNKAIGREGLGTPTAHVLATLTPLHRRPRRLANVSASNAV